MCVCVCICVRGCGGCDECVYVGARMHGHVHMSSCADVDVGTLVFSMLSAAFRHAEAAPANIQ